MKRIDNLSRLQSVSPAYTFGESLLQVLAVFRATRLAVSVGTAYALVMYLPAQSQEVVELFAQEPGLNQLFRTIVMMLLTAAIAQSYIAGAITAELKKSPGGELAEAVRRNPTLPRRWPLVIAAAAFWLVPVLVLWKNFPQMVYAPSRPDISGAVDRFVVLALLGLTVAILAQRFANCAIWSARGAKGRGEVLFVLTSLEGWRSCWRIAVFILSIWIVWAISVAMIAYFYPIKALDLAHFYKNGFFGAIASCGLLVMRALFHFEEKISALERLGVAAIVTRRWWLLYILVPACLVIGAIILSYSAVHGGLLVQRRFGPVFVLVYFAITFLAVASAIQYLGAHLKKPILSVLLISIVGGALFFPGIPRYPLALDALPNFSENGTAASGIVRQYISPSAALERWRLKDGDLEANQRRPVYLIAAQGGGLYAAYQAALTLAKIQDRCSSFSDNIFIASGVSGGAVGLLAFAAVSDAVKNHERIVGHFRDMSAGRQIAERKDRRCRPSRMRGIHQKLVQKIFESDFLTPILVHGLFIDLPFHFLGDLATYSFCNAETVCSIHAANRADALEKAVRRAIQHAMRKMFANGLRVLDTPITTFDTRMIPIVATATVAETGRPIALGPFKLPKPSGNSGAPLADRIPIHNFAETFSDRSLSLARAAVISARFPLVTPAASVQATDGTQLRLVDGGYFDNSGTSTLLNILSGMMLGSSPLDIGALERRFDVKFKVLVFNHSFDETYQFRRIFEIATPIAAVLNARSARGIEYVQAARILFGGSERFVDFPLADAGWRPRLGWLLTNNSKRLIGDRTGSPAKIAHSILPLLRQDRLKNPSQ